MNLKQVNKIIAGTQFEKDLQKNMRVNNGNMSKGMWNLLCSIRDCKLYSKGIKAHRNWKITDVKIYFGIKGSADKLAEQLEKMRDIIGADVKEKSAKFNKDAETHEELVEKGRLLEPNQSIRATSKDKSYHLFNFDGVIYIGSFLADKDRIEELYYPDQETFSDDDETILVQPL